MATPTECAAHVIDSITVCVDDGWKDTVLVMPGERVRILRRFTAFPGLFLYHCHILEHEGMGMMRNFRIDTT